MNASEPEGTRQRLQQMLAGWIDELASGEPRPDGVDSDVLRSAEPVPDLFSLLGQLTALTREVHLQARTMHGLHAEISAGVGRLAEAGGRPDAVAAALEAARRDARIEVVSGLLDVRDRLTRNLDDASRRLGRMRGLRARFGQRPVLRAVIDGVTLARERLDDLLRQLDVEEIPCLGRTFDPETMRAVETFRGGPAPAGTVIEVIRAGYRTRDRVLRFADVRVAADASPQSGGGRDG